MQLDAVGDESAALALHDGTVRIVSSRNGKVAMVRRAPDSYECLVVSPDQRWIAAGNAAGFVDLVDLEFESAAGSASVEAWFLRNHVWPAGGAEPDLEQVRCAFGAVDELSAVVRALINAKR